MMNMSRRTCRGAVSALGLALAVQVGGCKVGPDFETPRADLNEAWLDQLQASPEGSETNARWWETFGDPTLNRLLQTALQQNRTLRIAGLRVLEARARRGIAVGQFFPQQQNLVGAVQENWVSENSAAGAGDLHYKEDSFGLEAAWELDFWGRFRRGIEAADSDVRFSVADYDSVLVSLAAEVATNYILIRSLEERLRYARDNVRLQTDTLELTRARFEAGAVSELDVSTARSTLATTQALVPDLENSLRQTKLALCVLLGRTPSELDEDLAPAEGTAAAVPEAPASLAAGIPADLLRRRPDVRGAGEAAAAQCARIGIAVADLLPSISIAGSTGYASSTYETATLTGTEKSKLSDAFDDPDSFQGFIGLDINWPILNYGRITGNIRVQDARFEQALAAYEDTVLRAAADVESGLSDFLRSREQAGFVAESVAAASRSTELALIQYGSGAVDFIRVNDAQSTLVRAQDDLAVARSSIALGVVRAYRALGGGWEVREGLEFVDADTARRMRERTNWGDVLAPDWEEGRDLGFRRPQAPAAGGN